MVEEGPEGAAELLFERKPVAAARSPPGEELGQLGKLFFRHQLLEARR